MRIDFDGDLFRGRVRDLTGLSVKGLEYPGGRSRSTVRLVMSDGSRVYATARPMNSRSTQELDILWALSRANVACPRVVGVDEGFFLQSDIGSRRLSDVLAETASEAERKDLVVDALESLAEARAALDESGFSQRLKPRFASDEDRAARARLPSTLAETVGLRPPDYDLATLAEGLRIDGQIAVKADARPANAVVTEASGVAWIDWDRARRGAPLDDLISLLFDEYMILSDASHHEIFEAHLADCSDDPFAMGAAAYACFEGVLKCCRRLDLIVKKLRASGGWWDPTACLAEDRPGVSPIYVERLCERGSRWARRRSETEGLAEFFLELGAKLSEGSLADNDEPLSPLG